MLEKFFEEILKESNSEFIQKVKDSRLSEVDFENIDFDEAFHTEDDNVSKSIEALHNKFPEKSVEEIANFIAACSTIAYETIESMSDERDEFPYAPRYVDFDDATSIVFTSLPTACEKYDSLDRIKNYVEKEAFETYSCP